MSSDFYSIQEKTYLDSLYDSASNGGRKTRKNFLSAFFQDQYSILCKRENTDLLNIYFVDRIFWIHCDTDTWPWERNYFDIESFVKD